MPTPAPGTRTPRKQVAGSSGTIWTAAAALIVIVVLIIGLKDGASHTFWSRAALFLAIGLLIYRQITRRFRRSASRAADPDPKSKLNLS